MQRTPVMRERLGSKERSEGTKRRCRKLSDSSCALPA